MLFTLIALLATPPAMATGEDGFGPYERSPNLTSGKLEAFREVFVNPETFASEITPVQAASGSGALKVKNTSNASQMVEINGVKVGEVGPLTTATVHDLSAGVYDVTMTSPSGFTFTRKVTTEGAELPKAEAFDPSKGLKRDPNVGPAKMPTGTAPAGMKDDVKAVGETAKKDAAPAVEEATGKAAEATPAEK